MTWAALQAALTRKAARLAAARAEDIHRERRGDAARWHHARLLWPLFASRRR